MYQVTLTFSDRSLSLRTFMISYSPHMAVVVSRSHVLHVRWYDAPIELLPQNAVIETLLGSFCDVVCPSNTLISRARYPLCGRTCSQTQEVILFSDKPLLLSCFSRRHCYSTSYLCKLYKHSHTCPPNRTVFSALSQKKLSDLL